MPHLTTQKARRHEAGIGVLNRKINMQRISKTWVITNCVDKAARANDLGGAKKWRKFPSLIF